MTAQPQDHLPATPTTFTFQHKGEAFTIPHFKSLPIGAIRKARKAGNDTDATFVLLEEALGEGSKPLDAIDTMGAEEFAEFLSGWTGGAPLGESLDS
jgi:hypothetical protein